MSKRDRLHYAVDLRENYFNTFARPAGYKYDSVTAYPLPDRYNIHRMSLFINNTHIGTYFAPFSSTVTWYNLSASEFYTSVMTVTSTAYKYGEVVTVTSTATTTPGVLPKGIPKVYYYDYNGNLRYVAHVQPS